MSAGMDGGGPMMMEMGAIGLQPNALRYMDATKALCTLSQSFKCKGPERSSGN